MTHQWVTFYPERVKIIRLSVVPNIPYPDVEIRSNDRPERYLYSRRIYKEDWATLHAYVFIVIDCIEILSHSFWKQKVLHAAGCSTPRVSLILSLSLSLVLSYFFAFLSCYSFSLSFSPALSYYSFSLSINNTQQVVRRGSWDIPCVSYTPAMAYNKIRHRLQQQQHSY